MNNKLIALSAVAFLATSSFADTNSDLKTQLEMLKKQISTLEAKLDKNTKSIKKVAKKANKAKQLANGDNLKFSVDFRTSIDKINYKMVDGTKKSNNNLMTNRLWLKAAYAPSDNISFRSTLSYNKAYGDSANHSQANTQPGYANFDWVTNENATDNTIKVKEAYWLYMNDTFMGAPMAWTASIGRRPSTDGLGISLREDQTPKSPLSHTVNVEFDGASFRWNLDKVTPMTGSWIKLCMGRGLTNAKRRFSQDGADYAKDETLHKSVDMVGFIFVPYDNGQYSVHTQYSVARGLIGFNKQDMMSAGMVSKGYDPYSQMIDLNRDGKPDAPGKQLDGTDMKYNADRTPNPSAKTKSMINGTMMANSPVFQDLGDVEYVNLMFKAEGLGDGVNDFLDDTTLIASWAQSKTMPHSGKQMLGSMKTQTGNSQWLALNMPAFGSDRFGIEWNKGSKYWRSMTYGEDTMIGSKLAARGTAWEVYYNKKLTKALSASIRYTDINYDYTGSNGFFGAEGTPYTMKQAKAMYTKGIGGNVVESAQDLRVYLRYRY